MPEELVEARVGQILRRQSLTLATAESCTGGLLGHRLTNVPGSSDYYLGGLIAYADAVKVALLGVDPVVLEREGAVSELVAQQMARGVRRLLGADVGIGITGVAGPGGGTPEKPVGLVYIALSVEGGGHCQEHIWPFDRLGNKTASAEQALQLILEALDPSDRPE